MDITIVRPHGVVTIALKHISKEYGFLITEEDFAVTEGLPAGRWQLTGPGGCRFPEFEWDDLKGPEFVGDALERMYERAPHFFSYRAGETPPYSLPRFGGQELCISPYVNDGRTATIDEEATRMTFAGLEMEPALFARLTLKREHLYGSWWHDFKGWVAYDYMPDRPDALDRFRLGQSYAFAAISRQPDRTDVLQGDLKLNDMVVDTPSRMCFAISGEVLSSSARPDLPDDELTPLLGAVHP